MHHLNVRVAWHDNRWNGAVCLRPSENSFCVDLDRIREERDDARLDRFAGMWFAELAPVDQPPCRAESGGFMNSREWVREFNHPYQGIAKAQPTHGHLKPTFVKVPPYSTFAVPFNWMLRESQERLDESLAEKLPADEESPFNSAWVFGKARQEAICDFFFARLTPRRSLVFFYTKSGHPLGDAISRLLVGVGTIEWISKILRYESSKAATYPMWDRLFTHSIRPDGCEGLVLPYHDYLEPTGDPSENERRRDLLRQIAVVPEPSHVMAFSYAGELGTHDVSLSALVKCLDAVRLIRLQGIAKGPWEGREEWLNARIADTWKNRGAFPGAGSALEAIGMRLGTALVLELSASGRIKELDDPWPLLDAILRGKEKPPHAAYAADAKAASVAWSRLPEERRALLKLLSRFSVSPAQALRWFDPAERKKATRGAVTDAEILQNPYRIVETDLGDGEDYPVSIGVVDRGLMPDSTVAAAQPVPDPSSVKSPLDPRRVRAAFVSVLRRAAENGDALLAEGDAVMAIGKLDLPHACIVPADWLSASDEILRPEINRLTVVTHVVEERGVPCLQLTDVQHREQRLASILGKRASASLPSLGEKWTDLLVSAVKEGGGSVQENDRRHSSALAEQAVALEQVTTRKLSVLVGRAGTGKTTVLGALLRSARLQKDGVLFLAPTGKARVRLSQKASATANTVAQFLYRLGRYDGLRQRPLFEGKETHRQEKTVVIDESSMLTIDDLYAVLSALDLGHVQRLILVGDPNQLPPIGVGRPFADLVAHLDAAEDDRKQALARLTVELRTAAGAPSDSLKLASWYTREPQPVDADRVLSDLELSNPFNDLTIRFWETADDLHRAVQDELRRRLGVTDVRTFNAALGLTDEGWSPFDDHNGVEKFQILSPVRMHPYGVHDLNRWVQRLYRSAQLASARQPWGRSLGDEEIVPGDKVILIRNGKRKGYNGRRKEKVEDYLANGEIGIANAAFGPMKGKLLNVAFAQRPDVRFEFWPSQFGGDGAPLELAYALTVHKAQGSEFGVVFIVLPKRSRLLSRELLYTALTRSRQHLVLMIEGKDASFLYELTKPERSETARRNTNMFTAGVRSDGDESPYADHLVHRTRRGEMVRSKSELVIANHLFSVGLKYLYERPLEGTVVPGKLRPDFTFITDAGEVVVWEHLGMMHRDDYRKGWEWKKEWYERNGFQQGKNLFTTKDEPTADGRGALDSKPIEEIAVRISGLL
jgi:hypothetical protein